jgi:menaquinone-dependent protoporphyrinogen oxidase
MGRVGVFYGTSEGQTRRIAERIAGILREQGFESEALDLSSAKRVVDWNHIDAVIVGGSIHIGRHQQVVSDFVARELVHLVVRPSAFFSVSLAAASSNASEVDAARALAAKFTQNAGWQPGRVACFAGRLAYTKYGFFKRWMMKQIAAREGAPTDTTRDHEFTDWTAVREFALGVAADTREALAKPVAS